MAITDSGDSGDADAAANRASTSNNIIRMWGIRGALGRLACPVAPAGREFEAAVPAREDAARHGLIVEFAPPGDEEPLWTGHVRLHARTMSIDFNRDFNRLRNRDFPATTAGRAATRSSLNPSPHIKMSPISRCH